jgi:glycosyltransferase involved in cell wall biosynthesis
VALVGSVLPDVLCTRTAACHSSGNKFQAELLDAIRSASDASTYVLSTLPIGAFPKSRRIAIRGAQITIRPGVTGRLVPFINLLFLKQITAGAANTLLLTRWLWRNRRSRRFVLVYNLNPSISVPVLIATRLLGGKSVAVIADFPHNLSFDFRGVRGLLQRADVWVEAMTSRHFDGVIPLTQHIRDDFAPGRPVLVVEGGVGPEEGEARHASAGTGDESAEKICFFSGTLYEVNGIRLLLDAFRLIPDPSYRLWIFGKGPLEAEVRAAVARDARIVYGGFLTITEVMKHQRRATLLLNARPTDQTVARYTFPSKLLEYMVSGRPVLSTALPGIPEEYYEFLHLLRDENPLALARMIQDVCSLPSAELTALGQRARNFVISQKSWRRQGARICDFLKTI